MLCARVTGAGIGEGTSFDISARTFFYVSEAEVASLAYCSSPFIVSKAEGAGDVRTKQGMFCFRPGINPVVSVLPCLPAHLGFEPEEGDMLKRSAVPFEQATLNLVGGVFRGTWRGMSCSCNCCLLDDGSRCTSMGLSHEPLRWQCYTVSRAPAPVGKQGSNSFLARMVDGLLAGGERDEIKALAAAAGCLIKKRLRRFQSVKQAEAFVMTRALRNSPENWVQRWLQAKRRICRGADLWRDAKMEINARALAVGWKVPRGQHGEEQSWDEYVAQCVS